MMRVSPFLVTMRSPYYKPPNLPLLVLGNGV